MALVGLDRITDVTDGLGLTGTRITSDLRTMLDDLAREAGFADYPTLAAHQPASGPPSIEQLRRRLHGCGCGTMIGCSVAARMFRNPPTEDQQHSQSTPRSTSRRSRSRR